MKRAIFKLITVFSFIGAFAQTENNFEDIANREFLMNNSPRVELNSIQSEIRKSLETPESTNLMQHSKDFNPTNGLIFGKSSASPLKPTLEKKNYNIEDAYAPKSSGEYNSVKKGRDSTEYFTQIQTPTMVFLIIFGILLLFALIITFNNRDKSQDYKISPAYKNLSNENRLRADLIHSLEKMIKNVHNPAEDKFNNQLLFLGALGGRKILLLSNKIDLAKQYGLTIYATTEIIEECCLGAYASYME